jgi:hypothetical protein
MVTQNSLDQISVLHITDNQLSSGDCCRKTSRQIIQNDDLVSRSIKQSNHVGADIPSTTNNQDFHESKP